MKNNIENGIYIPEERRNLIPVDEWVKREDPTTAQTVVLVTDFGMLEIAKEDLPGGFNFEGAQKAAAEYRKGFRCPTRHEAIEMYDARFRGLDEAFKKIGGEPRNDYRLDERSRPRPGVQFRQRVRLLRLHGLRELQPQVWHVRRASGFRFQEIVSQFNHSRALYGARG